MYGSQKQNGLDTDTNIKKVNNNNNKERSSKYTKMLPPRGRHQHGKHRKAGQLRERQPFLIFCLVLLLLEFPVPPNGTASGFIKIYELNHHWKYKTLVGSQGEIEWEEEGAREDEEKGERGDTVRE